MFLFFRKSESESFTTLSSPVFPFLSRVSQNTQSGNPALSVNARTRYVTKGNSDLCLPF